MGKKGSGGKAASSGVRPPNWSFWLVGGAVVLFFAWSSIKEVPGKKKKKAKPAIDDQGEEEEEDDRIDAVIDALFASGNDGTSVLGHGKHKGSRFASQEYWDKRYTDTKKKHYDWYGTWDSDSAIRIKPYIAPELPSKVEKVLNVGCGNSRLAEELANDGFSDVVSIDISQAAIDKMLKKFAGRKEMSFLHMDATQMTFKDGTFDLAFDKGTLDALYTGAAELVKMTVKEVFRILKPGGLFVSLTFGQPSSRQDLNRTSDDIEAPPGWERFKMHVLDSKDNPNAASQSYYIYMMWKPA